jgi:glyoxylase-like metal-dependent hydrolase (beta-lactamase superfamily II)
MIHLSPGVSYLDLQFHKHPRIIATAVLHGASGVALVDPGPASTLPVLERELGAAGIGLADVTQLLLTHIHLDHAGAAGALVARYPRLRVQVHEAGAPHMVDPSKLLASAARLYGDAMDRLWGPVLPVPRDAIVRLAGGETIDAGGREWQVAHTPGHAIHHVSYYDRQSGVAFVGDTAGIRRGEGLYVLPPTPPPDIDLEAWERSLTVIERWNPETLFLTHFGPSSPARPHLAEFRDHLRFAADLAKASLERAEAAASDEEREAWFCDRLRQELRRRVGEEEARAYEAAGRFDLSWRGLARYWRKRAPVA